MKNMKKLLGAMLLVVAMSLFFTQAIQAKAVSCKLSYLSSTGTSAGFDVSGGDPYVEVQILSTSGKVVKKYTASSYASFSGLSKNKIYYYRARSVDYYGDAMSSWTTKKALSTIVGYQLKLLSNRYVQIYFPRVTGVKYYKFYTSRYKDSGFKKVATKYPGQYYRFNRVGGRAFVNYVTYYWRAYAVTTKGKTANANGGNFYIYRR